MVKLYKLDSIIIRCTPYNFGLSITMVVSRFFVWFGLILMLLLQFMMVVKAIMAPHYCDIGHMKLISLPFLCGCTGFSSSRRQRWNIVLPPHTGTGTLTMAIRSMPGSQHCNHVHTTIASHEHETASLAEFCSSNNSLVWNSTTAGQDLCGNSDNEVSVNEFTAVIVRNPFQRLLTASRYKFVHQLRESVLSREELIDQFRVYIKTGSRVRVRVRVRKN